MDKCIECENDILMKYSSLVIDYDKLQNYNRLLEKCLDTKDELCKVLREDNEALRNKLKLYEIKEQKTERKEIKKR